jgi:photosystem II stability/assembly factor-like uncharacterized protein
MKIMPLAATGSGVYRLLPRESGPWDSACIGFEGAPVVGVTSSKGTMLAAVRHKGLYASADGGGHWEALVEGVNPQAIGVSPEGAIFMGTNPVAVHRSRTGGDEFEELDAIKSLPSYPTWTFPNPPHLANIHDFAFSASDRDTVYAAVEVGGVIASRDGGTTWSERRESLHPDVHGLACAPGDLADVLYAATGMGFFRSRNAGVSWESACDGLDSLYLRAVGLNPERPQVIFTAAMEGRPRYWRTRPEGACTRIYRSEDAGTTWATAMGDIVEPLRGEVSALAVDPREPETVYAGTMDGIVLMSRDSGDSWNTIAADLPPVSGFGFAA